MSDGRKKFYKKKVFHTRKNSYEKHVCTVQGVSNTYARGTPCMYVKATLRVIDSIKHRIKKMENTFEILFAFTFEERKRKISRK